MEVDRVAPTFNDQIILLTGGTGFMGKILIEKILRCVDGFGQFYLLVRTKKGRTPEERLGDIFDNYLFDKVKEQRGLDYLKSKCRIISGDCMEENLGISKEDRQLIIDNVTIIYHCAATVRFDEPLKRAVILNTRGTKYMLDLGKQCKKLLMFAHVSTSYCHLNEKVLLEKPYPPPADPHKIIKTIEWLDDEVVESMTEKILGSAPNTYAYTKSLGEGLVVEAMSELPIVIYRPSIVIPTWLEPCKGWTDNINGPAGLLIGAGKGVIRTMYCKATTYGDFLPVDVAANAIMVTTWNYIANNDKSRNIFNLTSSAEIVVSWEEIVDKGRWIVNNKLPLNGVLWYPGGSMKKTRLEHNIAALFFHWIPAYVIDFLLVCLGYPPVLKRVHQRIQKGFEVFEYYANNQWDFDNANTHYMRNKVNAVEAKKYKIDGLGLDVMDYFENCIRASRLHILKESDETIPAAKRHMRIMYCVDKISKTLIVGLFIYFVGGFFLKLIFPSLFSSSSAIESITT